MKLLQLFCTLLLFHCALSFNHVITAPKAFRLGAKETVYLDLHGYNNGATVSAFLQDLPDRENVIQIYEDQAFDQAAAEHPIPLRFSLQPHNFRDFRTVQRVGLNVQVQAAGGGSFSKELEILVVPQSGYLFVITDQPAYRPGEVVLIKAFVLNQTMERDPTKVRILVKTPDGIGTKSQIRFLQPDNNFAADPHAATFAEDQYQISPDPEFGLWSVEVSYAVNGYDTSTEAQFLVDRFVLPTFQVNVVLDQEFVTINQNSIDGRITALYSYGERVTGSIYLVMRVKIIKDSGEIVIKKFYEVPEEGIFSQSFNNGAYQFSASMAIHLMPALAAENVTVEQLAANGGVIYVEATVTETGSGHYESAVSPNIPVLVSPLVIDTTRTELYYISGLVYTFRANLKFVTNKPAGGINYEITVNNVMQAQGQTPESGAINSQINFDPQQASQNIVFQAGDRQETFVITPYQSANGRYLRIAPAMNQVYEVGRDLDFSFHYNNAVPEIRFFVVARGTLVYSGVNYPVQGNVQSSQRFRVTQSMVPSARIVAYYIAGNTEIVSASFWFDVENVCSHELTIALDNEQIQPGDPVSVMLSGAPNALVSLTAVDRAAYFLYNGSRLTRDTMFDKMESYDQGCSRGGGRDGPDVFLESGLQMSTSTIAPSLLYNLDCSSEAPARKKRQAPVEEIDNVEVTKAYLDKRLEICNNSAVFESFINAEESCETRAARCREFQENIIVDECCELFERRCAEEETKRFINLILGNVGRSSADIAAAAGSVRTVRRNFDESLVFRNVRLDRQGNGLLRTPSEDSITNFEFDAASMEPSAADGFCVAETKNLRIFRNIFLQVYTAYAYKRREQASLRVAVFNYGDEAINVAIDVRPPPNDELCTHFLPEEWSELQRSTQVGSHASISTTINILPLRVGDGDTTIQFRVRLPNNTVVDLIEKTLRVEEVGEVLDTTQSVPIDLRRQNMQTFELRFNFPEVFVPGSRSCEIFAYPNFMGPSIEIDEVNDEPRDISTIFRMPYGCGEQTMLTTGPNVYAHMYLEATNNLVQGTPAYTASTDRIQAGFGRELIYRSDLVNKRAWSVFTSWAPSTWLNAFVDKVFTKALMYQELDLTPICSSLNWLLDQQDPNGEFVEHSRVIHREMHGGVGGSLTLTSYVVIALLETQSHCPAELNERVLTAATNAVNYLIANEDDATLQTPYGLALFAYALALHQPSSGVTNRVFNRLLQLRNTDNDVVHWAGLSLNEIAGTDIHPYWYQQKPLAVNIEATSYALLALIERESRVHNPPRQNILGITRGTVLWLIGQRNDGGAFVTTQDTVIGLQALATYQMWTASFEQAPPTNIDISFTAANSTWQNIRPEQQFLGLTDANARYRQSMDVPPDVINHQRVTVTATGSGEGVVSYRCLYRTQLEEEACHFNITHEVELLNPLAAEQLAEPLMIKLTVSVQARNHTSEMSIIEVGLMTGFVPIEQSVLRLSQDQAVDGVIQRYEITNVSVIFYVAQIPNNEKLTLAFDMQQQVPVGAPQPARIYVYDYYEPAVHCGDFYALDGFRPDILTSNCGPNTEDNEFCTCAEGGCTRCRTRYHQLNDSACINQRFGANCEVCEPGHDCLDLGAISCASNYVYEVEVTSVSRPIGSSEFYSFKADISTVLKEGDVEGLEKDSEATFLLRTDCLNKCQDDRLSDPDRNNNDFSNIVRVGNVLRIMGGPGERYLDRNEVPQVNFRLDSSSVIERVIPDRRCSRNRRNLNRLNCGTNQVKASNVERCKDIIKTVAGCDNQQALLDMLRQGCS